MVFTAQAGLFHQDNLQFHDVGDLRHARGNGSVGAAVQSSGHGDIVLLAGARAMTAYLLGDYRPRLAVSVAGGEIRLFDGNTCRPAGTIRTGTTEITELLAFLEPADGASRLVSGDRDGGVRYGLDFPPCLDPSAPSVPLS
jgi:hypothetical protein